MTSQHVLRMLIEVLIVLVLAEGRPSSIGPSCFLRSNSTQCLALEDENGPCTWTLCSPEDPCSANWQQEGVCHDAISIFVKLLQDTWNNINSESESLKKKSSQVMQLCDGFQNETPETVKVSSADLDIRHSPQQPVASASPAVSVTSSSFLQGAPSHGALLSTAGRARRLADGQNDCTLAKKALNLQEEMNSKELATVSTALKILNEGSALKDVQDLAKSRKFVPQIEIVDSVSLMETRSQIAPHLSGEAAVQKGNQSPTGGSIGAAPASPKLASLYEDETIADEAKSGCMLNIQREQGAKEQGELALLNVSSTITDLSDNIAALDREIQALGKSISIGGDWVSKQLALRNKEHINFLRTSAAFDSAKQVVMKALIVLQEFYGADPTVDNNEALSKTSLLKGSLQTGQRVTAILSIPTKYTKQDCSMAQRLMKRFLALLTTRMDESKTAHQAAREKYQHSEHEKRMAHLADEKSVSSKKHAKFILESRLMEHKQKQAQLAEDQKNINLRLRQLHEDCDIISHSIDSSIEAAQAGKDSMPVKIRRNPVDQKIAWIRAHHAFDRWQMVCAFFLLSIVLLFLLTPIVSMFGTLFHCSVISFIMPRHQKTLPNAQLSDDERLACNHLG